MAGSAAVINFLVGTAIVLGVSLYFWRKRVAGSACKSKARLEGKTVIITGANTGIGKETAVDLAKRRARVVLACRSVARGEEAAVDVRKKSGNDNVVFVQLDLASLGSVRQFAAKILEQEPRIDILINNAGLARVIYTETEDGYETCFATNHLGPFLLTNLLLHRLDEAPSARIVFVASSLYKYSKLDFAALSVMNTRGDGKTLYARSKLASMLFFKALTQRTEKSRISVLALHPGLVATGLFNYKVETLHFFIQPLARLLLSLLLKTPAQGAQTTIHCAVAEELEGVSGKYFGNCREEAIAPGQATDDHLAERLWQISSEMVGLTKSETWAHANTE